MAILQQQKCPCCGGHVNFDTASQKLKCPYCDTEMLSGYLNSGPLLWTVEKHKFNLNPKLREKYAFYLKKPMFIYHSLESYCCSNCKKIIIDVSEYEHHLD